MSEMGPRGKSPEDIRLDALLAHRKALDEAPEPAEDESTFKTLLPLILAQGLDLLSTEKPIGFNKRDDMVEQMNKFPGARAEGFGGTAGRLGSGALELVLAALLHKASPAVGKAYMIPSLSTHTNLARTNWEQMRERAFADKKPEDR